MRAMFSPDQKSISLFQLPDALQDRFLPGLIDPAHLTDAALAALHSSSDFPRSAHGGERMEPDSTRMAHLALALLRAAWEENPLDLAGAAGFAGLAEKLSVFDPGALLAGKIARGRLDPAETVTWREAEFAFLTGEFDRAAESYATLESRFGLSSFAYRAAECALRVGLRDSALSVWRRLFVERPWDASLALRLHDLEQNVDAAPTSPLQPVAICMFTWNRAAVLDETLAALAENWPEGSLLYLLDNGSTDATPHILLEWSRRLGPERIKPLILPVNVGAPAARNWLKCLMKDEPRPFVLYLDDDARLTPTTLARLQQAVELYPSATAWGAKVLDLDPKPAGGFPDDFARRPGEHGRAVQGADQHLRVAEDVGQPESLDLAALSAGAMSLGALDRLDVFQPWSVNDGRLDYVRPCAHVMGCCHLFRTRELLSGPDFDLRFSPSQFDDLDRDLTLLAYGGHAAYTGFATALHPSPPPKAARATAVAKLKLTEKRDDQTLVTLAVRQREALLDDLRRKFRDLGAEAPEPNGACRPSPGPTFSPS